MPQPLARLSTAAYRLASPVHTIVPDNMEIFTFSGKALSPQKILGAYSTKATDLTAGGYRDLVPSGTFGIMNFR